MAHPLPLTGKDSEKVTKLKEEIAKLKAKARTGNLTEVEKRKLGDLNRELNNAISEITIGEAEASRTAGAPSTPLAEIEIYNVGGGQWWTANPGYIPTNSGLNTQAGRKPGSAGDINIKKVPLVVWEEMQKRAAEENAKRGTENVPNAPEGLGDPPQPNDKFLGGLEEFFGRLDPNAVKAAGTAALTGASAYVASQLPNLGANTLRGATGLAGAFIPQPFVGFDVHRDVISSLKSGNFMQDYVLPPGPSYPGAEADQEPRPLRTPESPPTSRRLPKRFSPKTSSQGLATQLRSAPRSRPARPTNRRSSNRYF